MKNISYIIFIGLLLASSCKADRDCVMRGDFSPRAVRLSAESLGTRASFADNGDGKLSLVWTEGDKVGIFAETMSMMIGENVPYEVEISPKNPSECALVPGEDCIVWSGTDKHCFYAYSPFVPDVTDPHRVPFSLPASQRQAAASDISSLSDYVLLKSKVVEVTPSDDDFGKDVMVKLDFVQYFPIVEIRLKASGNSVGSTLVRASLSSSDAPLAAAKGSMDLLSDSDGIEYEEIASRSVSVSLVSPAILGGEASSVYLVTVPGEHKCLQLTLFFRDGTCVNYNLDPCRLTSGTRKVVDLTLGDASILRSGADFPCCLSFASSEGGLLFGQTSATEASFEGGLTLSRDSSSGTASDVTYTSNLKCADGNCLSSAAWTTKSYYLFDIPVSEMLEGRVRMDFKFKSCGWAEWICEWSADKNTWYSCTEGMFTHAHSTQLSTYCMNFVIPHTRAIPAGGHFYARLRPASDAVCTGGDIRTTDASACPTLAQSVIFTSCRPGVVGRSGGDELVCCHFDDCTEGVDAIGLGIGKVLGCCNIDGPLYEAYTNVWQRYGCVRAGAPGQKCSFYTPAFALDDREKTDVKLSLKLAAFRDADGKTDSGDISLFLCNGKSRTSQTYTISSGDLKCDMWTSFEFEFRGADSASTVEITSNSTRFYMDDITVRRAVK
ncbi:MAG: fimbrillin family protein [Bacteroidales bacterium]|nr:fimbrillin family protein [Bacteroidales bacterium]